MDYLKSYQYEEKKDEKKKGFLYTIDEIAGHLFSILMPEATPILFDNYIDMQADGFTVGGELTENIFDTAQVLVDNKVPLALNAKIFLIENTIFTVNFYYESQKYMIRKNGALCGGTECTNILDAYFVILSEYEKTKATVRDLILLEEQRLIALGNCNNLARPLTELLEKGRVALSENAIGLCTEDFLKKLGLVPVVSVSGWATFTLKK